MHSGSGLDRASFWLRYERYPYLLAKLVTFGLVGYGVFAALRGIQDVLTPVLVSLGIAYLLDPAIDWFEERGFSRTVGIALCMVVGGIAIALFLLFLSPTVAHLIGQVGDGVPKVLDLLQHQAIPWVETTAIPWVEWNTGLDLPSGVSEAGRELAGALEAQVPGILKSATNTIGNLWSQTGAIVSSLLNLVLIPVLTFYFLRDFDRMRLAAVDYLPQHNRTWLLDRIAKMDEVVGAWFRGQLEVAAILAGLYALGLGLTFGITGIGAANGVAIGLLSGLLNVIPYFGFLTGVVLSVMLALLDWSGWGPLVGVAVTFGVVQALEGYVITPRVVGEKVGLSPVVVIVTLLLGASLLGPLGVLLALPTAGALRVLLPDLIGWYYASDLFTGHVRVAPPEEPAPPPAPEPPPPPAPEPPPPAPEPAPEPPPTPPSEP
jgi:predicted PurR-regulated permease PerM